MPVFSRRALRQAMEEPQNIRCVCLIGHKGHGKTTLAKLLLERYGVAPGETVERLVRTPDYLAAATPAATQPFTSQVEVHTLLQTVVSKDVLDNGGDRPISMSSRNSVSSNYVGRESKGTVGSDPRLSSQGHAMEAARELHKAIEAASGSPRRVPALHRDMTGGAREQKRMSDALPEIPTSADGVRRRNSKGTSWGGRSGASDPPDTASSSSHTAKRRSRTSSMTNNGGAQERGGAADDMAAQPSSAMFRRRSSRGNALEGFHGGAALQPQLGQHHHHHHRHKRASDGDPQMRESHDNSGLLRPTRRFSRRNSADHPATPIGPPQMAPEEEIAAQHPCALVYLLDTPGHADLAAEVAAALRLADSAVLVVDVGEGVLTHTEALVRQALCERVRPALFASGLDRLLGSRRVSAQDVEARIRAAVDATNAAIEATPDELLGDVRIRPHVGGALFGSASQGWAFTLPRVARHLAIRFGVDSGLMAEKLWTAQDGAGMDFLGGGESFVGSTATAPGIRVLRQPTVARGAALGAEGHHGHDGSEASEAVAAEDADQRMGGKAQGKSSLLAALVLEPLKQLFHALMDREMSKANVMLKALGAPLLLGDSVPYGSEEFIGSVLRRWCDAVDSVWDLSLQFLPSPLEAQRYRMEDLYRGPTDDNAEAAVRACDPAGPLFAFVSRMLPAGGAQGRLFALGRIFSGKLSNNRRVQVHCSNRREGWDAARGVRMVDQVAMILGQDFEPFPSDYVVPCGNIVGILGPDEFLLKAGTLTDPGAAVALAGLHLGGVRPVVRVAVRPADPSDLPKLTRALRRLSQSDPLAVCTAEEWGEHVVSGSGEHHLDACCAALRAEVGAEVLLAAPSGASGGNAGGSGLLGGRASALSAAGGFGRRPYSAAYHETVRGSSEGGRGDAAGCGEEEGDEEDGAGLFEATAEPLGAQLCTGLEDGLFDLLSRKERARVLVDRYGWSQADGLNLWCFGPEDCGLNAVVDVGGGLSAEDLGGSAFGASGGASASCPAALDSHRSAVLSACKWATKEGVLCEEPLRGVRFALRGAALPPGSVRRGAGQVVSTVRRCLTSAQLAASPGLLEPVFWAEVLCPSHPEAYMAEVRGALEARRATILMEAPVPCQGVVRMLAELPGEEALGLRAALAGVAGGLCHVQAAFARWELLEGEPEDPESRHGSTVRALRRWRQLREDVPRRSGSPPPSVLPVSFRQLLEDDLEDIVVPKQRVPAQVPIAAR